MRVPLDADARVRIAEFQPEVAEPLVVEHETSNVRFVARVHDPDDFLWRVPGTQPQDLAFAAAAAARLEMLEGVFKHFAFDPVHHLRLHPSPCWGAEAGCPSA